MGKQDKNLLKPALEYFHAFTEAHGDIFVFHDYRFVNETVLYCKEIAKAEGLHKEEYDLGLVGMVLVDMGQVNSKDPEIDHGKLVARFMEHNEISEKDSRQISYYIDFFRSNKLPQNHVEEVLRDGKDIHLGMPDALEKMALLRAEIEKLRSITFNELQWLELCKQYFITHSFYTRYANRQYGGLRSKNFFDLDKRIDKLRVDSVKEKKETQRNGNEEFLSKESEDLFKIAFRNYLNLVALADRKAGLLIQINSIIASVIIGFVTRRFPDQPLYVIPAAIVLIFAAVTIFYGILASKPLERAYKKDTNFRKEPFFFGSFDRLDPDFHNVSWEKYSRDMNDLFRGEKKTIFEELIRESFQVRKVLAKKFGYLSIAYKVFFAGVVITIFAFLIVMGMNM